MHFAFRRLLGDGYMIGTRAGERNGKPEKVESFVIKKFTKEEIEILEPVISKTTEVLTTLINEGIERTMNEFN